MTKLHKVWMIAGLLTLLAATTGGIWLFPLMRANPSSGSENAAADKARPSSTDTWQASSPGTGSARALELEVGTLLVYTADFTTEFGQGAAPTPPNVASHSGSQSTGGAAKLSLRVAERTSEKVVMEGQVSDLSMAFGEDQENTDETLATMQRDLAPPFRVTFSASGRIDELGIAPNVSAFGLATIRSFLSALQFVEPPSRQLPDSWTTEEPDQYGVARVRYTLTSPGEYKKTKLDYVRLEVGGAFSAVPGRKPAVRS